MASLHLRRGRELLTDRNDFPTNPRLLVNRGFFCCTLPPGQAALKKDKYMKTNHRRGPARFGPETGFEVKPVPPALFQARQEVELERLKTRLLSEQLEARRDPQLGSQLRRAANEAAALAGVTRYPLLVFPALFQEKAEAALLRAERQEQVRQRSRELLVA